MSTPANIPSNCRYTKDHEWVKVDGQQAVVGITDFAQSELGDVVFVELPAIGKNLKKKESLAVVESTKAASDVYAPIGGVVAAVNSELSASSDKINSDPYGAGWMVKLEGIDSKDLEGLMNAEEYAALIKK